MFFDKDGTLVENVPYNVDPTKIALARGAPDAVRSVRDAGFRRHVSHDLAHAAAFVGRTRGWIVILKHNYWL